MRDYSGLIIVMPTPFDPDGAIDEASLQRMIAHYLTLDLQGLTIMGVMGEGSKLTAAESHHLMRRIFTLVDGKLPLIVGASNSDVDATVKIGEEAMALGAAGLMISPKPGLSGDAEVQAYFKELCERLGPDVPICVQDYPAASGVKISAEGLADMFETLPQLAMVKLEDMPNLGKLTHLLERFSKGRQPRPTLFVGNHSLFADLELARGADGIMSGFAIAEALADVIRLHKSGNVEEAVKLYNRYLPLIRYEMQPGLGLAARKYMLQKKGLMATCKLRDPGYDLAAEDKAELDRMLVRLDLETP